MRPKLAEVYEVVGLFNCVLLKKLKNSARYCKRQRSRIVAFLSAEKSTLNVPGPSRMLRPELPKLPRAAGRKDSVVNHFRICCSREPEVRAGLEITSALSLPM